jgi:hypothetical protein
MIQMQIAQGRIKAKEQIVLQHKLAQKTRVPQCAPQEIRLTG